eukprot:GHVT01001322.1.p1 GENE.GHVT01001322.1~~GHVT01001322.1.p1  ORF type:complete len:106 (+),score=9.59 GHVT01001322.1:129-446(+)
MTIRYHYGKHHAGYVRSLNAMAQTNQEIMSSTLEELIRKSEGTVFNFAAQAWNHAFFWESLSPSGGGTPTGKIAEKIAQSFTSFDKFKEQFTTTATSTHTLMRGF